MSRRRQRGAAYRARRAESRAWGAVKRDTQAYVDWMAVRVAEGAQLDELAKLVPVDAEEYRRRVASIVVEPTTAAERAVRMAPRVTVSLPIEGRAVQLPDGTWDVEYGLA